MSTRTHVISLYKSMMRNARGFKDYNFREYAIRRVRAGFVENRAITDEAEIVKLIRASKPDLDLLKRQSIINNMYTKGEYFATA